MDAAARTVIAAAGFGPGYAVPGLPHRTGHGLGLDIHEDPWIVKGNQTALQPGMCFSIEPMLCLGTAEWDMWDDRWTVTTKDKRPSAQFEHTLLVTPDGAEILTLP